MWVSEDGDRNDDERRARKGGLGLRNKEERKELRREGGVEERESGRED